MEQFDDLKYLEELRKKYKKNKTIEIGIQDMLLAITLTAVLALSFWVNTISAEQQRRTTPVYKMEQELFYNHIRKKPAPGS